MFVAVEKKTDRLGNAIRGLIQGCQPGAAVQMRAPFCGQPDSKHSFQQFLNSHIQQARNKRFEETITSRHALPQSTHFEVKYLMFSYEINQKKVFSAATLKTMGFGRKKTVQFNNGREDN